MSGFAAADGMFVTAAGPVAAAHGFAARHEPCSGGPRRRGSRHPPTLGARGQTSAAPSTSGQAQIVEVIKALGQVIELTVAVRSGLQLRARSVADLGLAPGSTCRVDVDGDAVSVWQVTGAGRRRRQDHGAGCAEPALRSARARRSGTAGASRYSESTCRRRSRANSCAIRCVPGCARWVSPSDRRGRQTGAIVRPAPTSRGRRMPRCGRGRRAWPRRARSRPARASSRPRSGRRWR